MAFPRSSHAIVLMGLAGLLLGAAQSARAGLLDAFGAGADPDRVGPFEVRLHRGSHWVGAWESKTHTVRYSIRHRGKAVELPAAPGPQGEDRGKENRFDQVLAFDAPQPALLVGSGSASYAHQLWLLREHAGALRVERLGPERGERPGTLEWLEGAPLALPRSEDTVAVPRISGGRWLLAGWSAVLDTQTMTVHRLAEPPVPVHDSRVLWRSPDGRSFVRTGVGEGYPVSAHLVVFDVQGGQIETLPLDQRRMRYADADEFQSPVWLAHHFQWLPRRDGGYRLAARATFKPWPRRGQIVDGPQGTEYVLGGVGPDLLESWLRCAEREFGARRVSHRDPAAVREDGGETVDNWRYLAVGDSTLAVFLAPDGELRVWRHRGDDQGLVQRIAQGCEDKFET